MSWFAHWFDSPYYHILYKNRDEKEAEFFIDNLISKLQLNKGSKLIDIACGKGRHATYFNKKGMDVVGIDLSENSIAVAKKMENSNLQFSVHDMREVFQENHFDIATNLFTSFGYFEDAEDEQKTINAMAKNLNSGGILILDFLNAKKAIANLVEQEKKDVDGIIFNISKKFDGKHIIKNIAFSDKGKDYHFQEKVKALSLAEFSVFIDTAGLKIIDIFGNYNLENFDATSSDRLILICKK